LLVILLLPRIPDIFPELSTDPSVFLYRSHRGQRADTAYSGETVAGRTQVQADHAEQVQACVAYHATVTRHAYPAL